MSRVLDGPELRPRVFITSLIQPGDVVLTTTPEPMSQAIRKITGVDISHAMICVGKSSVIDSTGDGVHARNLDRIFLEPGCSAYVLRPVEPLTIDQLHTVTSFARAAIGARYTKAGAAKSVLAGFVAGRRQFCSRLVAQAYRSAGIDLVPNADFCHPGELLKSEVLIEVPDVLKDLDAEEESYWREALDNVQAMRDSTNALLHEARKLSSEIESLNDIDAYLMEHEEGDAHLVQALQASRYLELWHEEFERNAWQYHVAMIEGRNVPENRKQKYCEELLADQKLGQNRFVINHGLYVGLNAVYPRKYFALQVGLYNLLANYHALRIKAATAWLERRGLLDTVPRRLLRPHSAEWFASLREWDPKKAAMTEAATTVAGTFDVCSICADEPARDYAFVRPPAAGPGTIRLCDDCFGIQSIDNSLEPF